MNFRSTCDGATATTHNCYSHVSYIINSYVRCFFTFYRWFVIPKINIKHIFYRALPVLPSQYLRWGNRFHLSSSPGRRVTLNFPAGMCIFVCVSVCVWVGVLVGWWLGRWVVVVGWVYMWGRGPNLRSEHVSVFMSMSLSVSFLYSLRYAIHWRGYNPTTGTTFNPILTPQPQTKQATSPKISNRSNMRSLNPLRNPKHQNWICVKVSLAVVIEIFEWCYVCLSVSKLVCDTIMYMCVCVCVCLYVYVCVCVCVCVISRYQDMCMVVRFSCLFRNWCIIL